MYYKYPITATNGDITLHSSEDTAIADAITSALLTQQDERVMRPDYGLSDTPFQAITPGLTSRINDALQVGLVGFDVAYTLQTTLTDDGAVNAAVTYENRTINVTL